MTQGLHQVHYTDPNGLQPTYGNTPLEPSLNEFQKGVQLGSLGLKADMYEAVCLWLGVESLQQTGDTGYAEASATEGSQELAGRLVAGT